MFFVVLACLFVCLSAESVTSNEWICTIFFTNVCLGPMNNLLDFGDDYDLDPRSALRSGSRGVGLHSLNGCLVNIIIINNLYKIVSITILLFKIILIYFRA